MKDLIIKPHQNIEVSY